MRTSSNSSTSVDPRLGSAIDCTDSATSAPADDASTASASPTCAGALNEDAAIVRLYGRATVTPLNESPLKDRVLAQAEPTSSIGLGLRQVVEVEVASTATSCGYGVPLLELRAQRTKSEHGRRYKD